MRTMETQTLENFFQAIRASVPQGARRSEDCKDLSEDVITQYDRWLRENILEDATPDEVEDTREMLVAILQSYTGWLLNRGHIDPHADLRTRMRVWQELAASIEN